MDRLRAEKLRVSTVQQTLSKGIVSPRSADMKSGCARSGDSAQPQPQPTMRQSNAMRVGVLAPMATTRVRAIRTTSHPRMVAFASTLAIGCNATESRLIFIRESSWGHMSKGFVYVLSNAAMPGLLKIGFSTKVPSERAAELSSTGLPNAFTVEYYCLVERPSDLEASVHAKLAHIRHSQSREFFRLEVREAIKAIEDEAPDKEHTWYRLQPLRQRPTRVACKSCGASYVTAEYCPKCRLRLTW